MRERKEGKERRSEVEGRKKGQDRPRKKVRRMKEGRKKERKVKEGRKEGEGRSKKKVR